jgi:hypothetical protein
VFRALDKRTGFAVFNNISQLCIPASVTYHIQVKVLVKCTAGGRQPWDIGRFAKTVAFFNEPPSPQQLLEALMSAPAKALAGFMGQGGSTSSGSSAPQVRQFCLKRVAEHVTGMQRSTSQGTCTTRAF